MSRDIMLPRSFSGISSDTQRLRVELVRQASHLNAVELPGDELPVRETPSRKKSVPSPPSPPIVWDIGAQAIRVELIKIALGTLGAAPKSLPAGIWFTKKNVIYRRATLDPSNARMGFPPLGLHHHKQVVQGALSRNSVRESGTARTKSEMGRPDTFS